MWSRTPDRPGATYLGLNLPRPRYTEGYIEIEGIIFKKETPKLVPFCFPLQQGPIIKLSAIRRFEDGHNRPTS